ncbi:hypothetical protein [Novosphingobium sp.]|uniref:hypothetical protein n=1 Tax=Novosphingobium sp. TaxID=1874826 RepID=UPI0026394694|nr:hypothetical protein [Novosphingobium sp.]
MNTASKPALRVSVHVPVAASTLEALLAGDRSALESDPVMARMLAILRAPGALGDFGIYHGVAEIGLGWETFAPSQAANPTLGAAGEVEHSPTVTLTTWIPADAPAEAVDAALAALMDAHPWEVPVIEVIETRLLVRGQG